jgi:hypothetical protein
MTFEIQLQFSFADKTNVFSSNLVYNIITDLVADKTNYMVQALNIWLYNINYRYAVDCLNILSFVTYIENIIIILYTRLELKTLVLSAKENWKKA